MLTVVRQGGETLQVELVALYAIEVLAETAGELVLAKLVYDHGVGYELVTHPYDCSPEALAEAAALLPKGVVPISVTPSACLGDVGETCVNFWAIPQAR